MFLRFICINNNVVEYDVVKVNTLQDIFFLRILYKIMLLKVLLLRRIMYRVMLLGTIELQRIMLWIMLRMQRQIMVLQMFDKNIAIVNETENVNACKRQLDNGKG